MRRLVTTALAAPVAVLALTTGLLAPSVSPAAAAGHTHYKETARTVAKEIGCKRFRRTGEGVFNYDAGVCWVGGKRVNVITFKGKAQQRNWNTSVTVTMGTKFHWADGKGAVVVARNGNKAAAKVGARRLPGKVKVALFG